MIEEYCSVLGAFTGGMLLFDGDADKRRVEWELENRLAPDGDSERPPRNAPKDKWLRIGQLVGGLVGALAGLAVGLKLRDLSPNADMAILGIFLGAMVGVIIGSIVGAVGPYVWRAVVRKHS